MYEKWAGPTHFSSSFLVPLEHSRLDLVFHLFQQNKKSVERRVKFFFLLLPVAFYFLLKVGFSLLAKEEGGVCVCAVVAQHPSTKLPVNHLKIKIK